MADINDIASYIWTRAPQYSVDPSLALGIARGEGLVPGTINSPYFGNRDTKGYSYGPFQLYSASPDPNVIAGGGLASTFKAKYGAAPNVNNWKEQVDFSLGHMAANGTRDWHAVKNAGGEDAITARGASYAQSLGLQKPYDVQQEPMLPAPAGWGARAGQTDAPIGNINPGGLLDSQLPMNTVQPYAAPTPIETAPTADQAADAGGMKLDGDKLGAIAAKLLDASKPKEKPKTQMMPLQAHRPAAQALPTVGIDPLLKITPQKKVVAGLLGGF
jgi:hypothetical protein